MKTTCANFCSHFLLHLSQSVASSALRVQTLSIYCLLQNRAREQVKQYSFYIGKDYEEADQTIITLLLPKIKGRRVRSSLCVCLFPWASAASHGCTAACWLIVPPELDVPTLATRCPRAYWRVPHSSSGSWNLWAENNDREFYLSADFHGTLRDLLHAPNLRHGTHGFTSLPQEDVLTIFLPLKIRRLRPGLNPRTWVPEASTLTPRPPKPLNTTVLIR
jgi:hypothetical protein